MAVVSSRHSDIARLNPRLVDAVNEERSWIAHELHDDIQQQIAALSMELDRAIRSVPASNHRQRELLRRARARTTALVSSVAELSRKLSRSRLSSDKRRR